MHMRIRNIHYKKYLNLIWWESAHIDYIALKIKSSCSNSLYAKIKFYDVRFRVDHKEYEFNTNIHEIVLAYK